MKLATLLFTFDDPELAGVADILDEQIAKEAAVQQFEWQRKFVPVAAAAIGGGNSSSSVGGAAVAGGGGASSAQDGSEDGQGSAVAVSGHREALYKTLQDLFSIPKDTIMVISLMAGRGKEDYVQVRELCQHTSPPIHYQIVPYVGGLKGDTALMVRNIVRCVSAFITGRIPGDATTNEGGFTAQGTFAGSPNTFRGIPCSLTSDEAGKLIAYGCGNNAMVRSVENPNEVIVCTRHVSQVTCARLSPSGALCASGDKDGNVIIWATRADTFEKLTYKALGGAVRDIAWSDDQERLIAVGEGKSGYAAVFTITGNTIGTICGHTQAIVACDFKKSRPYRVATGGQDSLMAFFEGPPFKFKHTLQGHKGTVNCMRYSPDNTAIATVSGLADIIILDGVTGDKQRTITTDHTGTVMGVAWSKDGGLIATCSTDATVRLWNAVDGSKVAETTAPAKKTVDDHVLGVSFLPDGRIVTVTLGSEITFHSADLKSVAGVWRGHSRPIVAIQSASAANGNQLVSVGVDSRVFSWGPTGASPLVQFPTAEVDVLAAQVTPDAKSMIALANTDIVECTLSGGAGAVKKIGTQNGGAVGMVVLPSGLICILQKQMMYVFSANGEKKHDVKLMKFDASSIAAVGADTVLVGGDHAVKIFTITAAGAQEKGVFTAGHEQAVVTALAVSADGSLVASGDSTRRIVVWKLADQSVVQDGLMYHSGRITALTFDPASSARLLSGSMDCSFALWDVPNKKKLASEDGAHRNGVTAVGFAADGTVNTAGADGAVRVWAVATA